MNLVYLCVLPLDRMFLLRTHLCAVQRLLVWRSMLKILDNGSFVLFMSAGSVEASQFPILSRPSMSESIWSCNAPSPPFPSSGVKRTCVCVRVCVGAGAFIWVLVAVAVVVFVIVVVVDGDGDPLDQSTAHRSNRPISR